MTSNRQLGQIYSLMCTKLRSIQIEDNFDRALEDEKLLTYIGKPDNYFFQRMVDLIFQAGIRGTIWLRYEPQIQKYFVNYNVKKVAKFDEKDTERMISDPMMFRNRMKIQSCIYNAKLIVKLSREYRGFWVYLHSHTPQELIKKLYSFKNLSHVNVRAFLRYVGLELMKPDLNVRRVLYQLGLIDSSNINQKTLIQIQKVGEKMAKAVGENVKVVDYVLYQYGAGEKTYVKYAVCGKVPKCDECPLTKCCKHFIEVMSTTSRPQ